jgi:hypothetical protein
MGSILTSSCACDRIVVLTFLNTTQPLYKYIYTTRVVFVTGWWWKKMEETPMMSMRIWNGGFWFLKAREPNPSLRSLSGSWLGSEVGSGMSHVRDPSDHPKGDPIVRSPVPILRWGSPVDRPSSPDEHAICPHRHQGPQAASGCQTSGDRDEHQQLID